MKATVLMASTLRAMLNPDLCAVMLEAARTKPFRSWRDGGGAYDGAIEAWRLKYLNHQKLSWVHERINERAVIVTRIKECERDGKVGIIESGRDCDCVDYVHPKGTIPANWAAYAKLQRDTGEYADGPFYLGIVTPEEEDKQPYESHDRVLEAFEEGHPHVVYSSHP